ncbi:hypothetical protein SJI19_16795 [Acerihabitans sp. TG2]|uniref:hypothetical protein n=1 Tax=Acerihabitans sp. TG2 TaxID=3096008 RepID=UPI002B224E15|nr:hypothetical protein [Acerihabitans sp. TG2]MEA9392184.1 hypothetical protein [Acerihabitans sp. TG2]
MSFNRDYKVLIEQMAQDKNAHYFLNAEQLTDKQLALFFTDSILCIADAYMKAYKLPDTNLDFVMERSSGNLSPFPLSAVPQAKATMFSLIAPVVSYVFEEHILPYAGELSVVYQLAGSVLEPGFNLQQRHPELVTQYNSIKSATLINATKQEVDMSNGRSIS